MTDTSLKNKYDSIIFDLDGTLWDSTANVAIAWQAAKQEVDYIQIDIDQAVVRSITGLTYKTIFEKLFPYLDEKQREEFKAIAAKKELEILNERGGQLYPELEETLKYLQVNYKLFLVSNCQNGYAETFFNHSNLKEYFLGYQCYGTKSLPKWDNIRDIVNDFNLQAPVYVGDTQADYEATVKAGVPFIFAAYGFGKVEQGMVATVNSFAELREIL
ncbi:HAD family hydrolase [Mucilaginibacter limnophilus]|uniref:phosphoglycolate phosphatase n=1 Tax=Mucilaginibacter limnophilus TaxID=1932778 RepID=A0A437MUY1_9SPHI|nr:HAD family hydrolase [Mucilaginibacter limnophilus]RVU01469.1 HAD family hydrolase [Mucilaginibacter limnophilus]